MTVTAGSTSAAASARGSKLTKRKLDCVGPTASWKESLCKPC
jgi:hypothetical protein